MWDVRVPALILAAGLTLGSPLYAQAPPDISLPPGDAARGKTIFEAKGNCQGCHRINGVGSLFGPDLSAIGAPRGGGGGGRGGNAAAPVPPAPAPAVAAAPPAATPTAPAAPPPVPEAPRGGGGGGQRGGQAGGQAGQGGAIPTPQQLAQSILDPNATVSVQNRYVVLKMK